MDRASERLEEERYFADRAADAMLHLERCKAARMKNTRTKYSDPLDYSAMSDFFYGLGQVQLIMQEFHSAKRELPEYVREAYRNEINMGAR